MGHFRAVFLSNRKLHDARVSAGSFHGGSNGVDESFGRLWIADASHEYAAVGERSFTRAGHKLLDDGTESFGLGFGRGDGVMDDKRADKGLHQGRAKPRLSAEFAAFAVKTHVILFKGHAELAENFLDFLDGFRSEALDILEVVLFLSGKSADGAYIGIGQSRGRASRKTQSLNASL